MLCKSRHDFQNHHAVGAVPASTPDGGMTLGQVAYGMLVQFVSGLGWAITTAVIGTHAASRLHGGMLVLDWRGGLTLVMARHGRAR